jgi:hypothetical protein
MSRTARKPATNKEGLTQSQFMHAVGSVPIMELGLLAAAWKRGEDPAEWKHHYQQLELLKPGRPVRVRQLDASKWAQGGAATFTGVRGHVERVKPANEHEPAKVLVAFDSPVEWKGGSATRSPATGFWFDPAELELS